MSNVAPGWYADPQNASFVRWWDGFRWTEHGRPAAAPQRFTGPQSPAPAPTPQAPAHAHAVQTPAVSAPNTTDLSQAAAALRAELADLSQRVIEMREMQMLQEIGLYRYAHPLQSATAYKERLASLDKRIVEAAKRGEAVKGASTWSVNGSSHEGARMVSDFSKLMLRAYNNEVENAVRTMKPYALDSAKKRVELSRATITKLGARMQIEVTEPYHRLRIEELELTSDYLAKVAEEKDREREERARLREEEIARKELERENAKLLKERSHYENVIEQMRARGDETAAVAAEAKLQEIAKAIKGLSDREANIRAGYVYVISNHGSFGEQVVKIGMTRRLEPMDRVRELGDASVPFRFDVHAIIFSDDAVGLETKLHHRFAERRVNMVNAHREFFFVNPVAVRDALTDYGANLLTFTESSEALEWRRSCKGRPADFDGVATALFAPPTGLRSDLPPPNMEAV